MVMLMLVIRVCVCARFRLLAPQSAFVSVVSVGVKSMPSNGSRQITPQPLAHGRAARASYYCTSLRQTGSNQRIHIGFDTREAAPGFTNSSLRSLQMPRLCRRVKPKDLQPNLPLRRLAGLEHWTVPVSSSLWAHYNREYWIVKVELWLNRDKRAIQRSIHSHRLDRRAHRNQPQPVVILRIAQLRHRPIFHKPRSQMDEAVIEIQCPQLDLARQ